MLSETEPKVLLRKALVVVKVSATGSSGRAIEIEGDVSGVVGIDSRDWRDAPRFKANLLVLSFSSMGVGKHIG